MTAEELRALYDKYLYQSTGYHKIQYNWRDVALYGLAVGATEHERQYFYEKYLQTLPTFGAIPCYNAINNEPQHPLPETAFTPIWDELNRDAGKRVVGLDFDHEIVFHRPIDPIKGSLVFDDKVIKVYDRGDKGIVLKTHTPVYDEAGRLLCENFGTAALFGGGNFGGEPFPASPVGEWIIMFDNQFDWHFWKLLEAIGRADLVGDPRWTNIEDTKLDKAPELTAIMDEAFSKMTSQEAIDALSAIDISVELCRGIKDTLNDPQTLENDYLFDWTLSSGDKEGMIVKLPASPVTFNGENNVSDFKRGPRLGEHTLEALKSVGYTEEEIRAMAERKVTVIE